MLAQKIQTYKESIKKQEELKGLYTWDKNVQKKISININKFTISLAQFMVEFDKEMHDLGLKSKDILNRKGKLSFERMVEQENEGIILSKKGFTEQKYTKDKFQSILEKCEASLSINKTPETLYMAAKMVFFKEYKELNRAEREALGMAYYFKIGNFEKVQEFQLKRKERMDKAIRDRSKWHSV